MKSPKYKEEAEATADLDAIRNAQETGELVRLPWLSVRGGEILAAQIVGTTLPKGPRVL